MMRELTTSQLGQACRIFMELAYPGGTATIPLKKRAYYAIDPARPLRDFLPPASEACGIAQDLSTRKDGSCGYEFRLGSAYFPHMKLRVLLMEQHGESVWVYTVDTHDAFSRHSVQPPTDHPDAAAWLALQDTNRQLKDRIEDELEQAGFPTFKGLLRGDLGSPVR